MTATLVLRTDVDAPVEQTWAGAVDWAGQGVGGGIAAFTGLGPLGFLDTMVITRWEPPRSCHVLHTGRIVRGTGAFDVDPRGEGRSTFVWREDLELPLGVLGRLGWPLVKPFFAFGVKLSLKRFARWVERGRTAQRAA